MQTKCLIMRRVRRRSLRIICEYNIEDFFFVIMKTNFDILATKKKVMQSDMLS